jgi:hypothetical protein
MSIFTTLYGKLVLLAFFLAITSGVSHGQSSQLSGASSSSSGTDQATVKKYWTPQRMREAKPLELHPKVEVRPPKPASTPSGYASPTGGSGSPPSSGRE